ncbi:MAG: permease, major facilitator superfamily [Chlamydiales bacterium]|jgi:predicted MFS family arabinose efflux permease|nr:permease, major facilitator superfamily [Chlamydiales bacterium]
MIEKKTRLILLWTFILTEPLYTSAGLLSFILRKDLGATPLQIAILTTLKPIVSVFSLYWSHLPYKNTAQLKRNVLLGHFLARVPYFFYPWVESASWIIVLELFHLIFARGSHPPFAELLRLNLPEEARTKTYALGQTIAHLEGALLGVFIGKLLDANPLFWHTLYPIAALIGLLSVLLQTKLPLQEELSPPPLATLAEKREETKRERLHWNKLTKPWQEAIALLKKRPDFRLFQWGYMIEAFGMMLIQPALPLFFADVLHLSHAEVALAISFCKNIGFIAASFFWARTLSRESLFPSTALIFFFRGLYIACLILAEGHFAFLLGAYLIYGIAIAGSHLCWSLSGTLFAKDEDSSLFSSINIMAIAIRGSLAPPLGGLIVAALSAKAALLSGLSFPLFASILLYQKGKKLDSR